MAVNVRPPLARKLIAAVVTLAVVAIGADAGLDPARERLLAMSPRERADVLKALRQFDVQLTPAQQTAIRELDRKLQAMPEDEKEHYLAVLRRYHNWLATLPETVRDGLQAKADPERLSQARTLAARYTVPSEATPPWMQFSQVAGPNPIDLAATFKIWQELTPAQRKELEGTPAAGKRASRLGELAHQLKVARDIRPADFHLEDWIPKVESRLAQIRAWDPELKTALARAETQAKRKNEANDQPLRPPLLLRRLAFNLYFQEQPPPKPVDPRRLAQFFSAMPPWVRGSFDSYSADEARRRLTLAYRVLFPSDEFQAARPQPKASEAAKRPAGPAAPPAPEPNQTRPARPPSGSSSSPF